jgi:hypothetical protein
MYVTATGSKKERKKKKKKEKKEEERDRRGGGERELARERGIFVTLCGLMYIGVGMDWAAWFSSSHYFFLIFSFLVFFSFFFLFVQVRTTASVATFERHESAVTGLAFSENGFAVLLHTPKKKIERKKQVQKWKGNDM